MLRSSSAIQPLVVALCGLLFLVSVSGLFVGVQIGLQGQADFRQLYTAGYMVRSGHRTQLYDFEETQAFQNRLVTHSDVTLPFNHLAYESLLFAPLSFLSYKSAYLVFLIFNLAVLVAIFWMMRRYVAPLGKFWEPLPVALFACFLPVTLALILGQDSILLLGLMVCSTIKIDRGRDFTAGAILGLTLFKFQYALPIILLFICWRRWRFILGFGASAVLIFAISIHVTGIAGFVSYLHSLVEMSAKFSPYYSERFRIHPMSMPNVRGLAYMVLGGSPFLLHVFVILLSGAVLLWISLRRPSLPLALLAAILVSYHGLISDMAMMILPLAWALAAPSKVSSRKANWILAVAVIIFAGPSILLWAGNRFYFMAIPMLMMAVLWDGRLDPRFSGVSGFHGSSSAKPT
jgi:hypothetical protein